MPVGKSLALAAVLAASFAPAAHATLTIKALNYGGRSGAVGGVAYYASTDVNGGNTAFDQGTATSPFHDPDTSELTYGVVNLAATSASSSLSEALSFSITSSAPINPPSGQAAYLMLKLTPQNTVNKTAYVPIAGFNAATCTGTICRNVSDAAQAGMYAVPYTQTGGVISIQIFPKDLCATAYAEYGLGAVGCSNALVATSDPQTGVTATAIQITWQIAYMDSSNVIQGTVPDSGTLNLAFQTSMADWTCPSNLLSKYTPLDSSIRLDATGFGAAATGAAPFTTLIAAGKLYSSGTQVAPVLNSTYTTANSFTSANGFSATELVSGFENTDATGNKTYTLGFMVRDATGMISPVSSADAACTMGPLQTSQIYGFLSESKCFIATAAFRSMDAAPVDLLRQFRDEVLSRHALGRQFIDWYYDWSPAAAEWLIRHPHARLPVLEALVPVEIAAWLMLHPVQMMMVAVLLGSGTILGILFMLLMRAKQRRAQE